MGDESTLLVLCVRSEVESTTCSSMVKLWRPLYVFIVIDID